MSDNTSLVPPKVFSAGLAMIVVFWSQSPGWLTGYHSFSYYSKAAVFPLSLSQPEGLFYAGLDGMMNYSELYLRVPLFLHRIAHILKAIGVAVDVILWQSITSAEYYSVVEIKGAGEGS